MSKFYYWINEQDEVGAEAPDIPTEEPMEVPEEEATKEDKDLMRSMMAYLVLANNIPTIGEDAINIRKNHAKKIYNINDSNFVKAENRLLKLGLIDYELDITPEGKKFLKKYKVDDARPEELNKFLRLSGDAWIEELWGALQEIDAE